MNGAFIEIVEIKPGKRKITAKLSIHYQDKKETKKKLVSVFVNNDLFEKSGGNPAYRYGFAVNDIDIGTGEIKFSGGLKISRSSNSDVVRDEIMKNQIRETVREHLAKEKRLNPLGVKVLSLFFIDRVENYRTADGSAGKFALWFEEIYRELSGSPDTAGVHGGYFSKDKKGRLKNTDGTTQADNDTYRLIMRDKETCFPSAARFALSFPIPR